MLMRTPDGSLGSPSHGRRNARRRALIVILISIVIVLALLSAALVLDRLSEIALKCGFLQIGP